MPTPPRKLGRLQRAALELAERNEGRIWPEIIYREMYGHPPRGGHGERETIDAATRSTVSRVLWSLEKRGLIKRSAEGRGFEVCGERA